MTIEERTEWVEKHLQLASGWLVLLALWTMLGLGALTCILAINELLVKAAHGQVAIHQNTDPTPTPPPGYEWVEVGPTPYCYSDGCNTTCCDGLGSCQSTLAYCPPKRPFELKKKQP